MKATELIAALQALVAEHGDIEVLVDGYEGGYDTAHAPDVCFVAPDPCGACGFMGDFSWCPGDDLDGFNAIVIGR